jgi:predicted RNase H-like nuclease (RuvC/YqgF family)
MSDTPRTDKEIERISSQFDGDVDNSEYAMDQMGKHARELERELAQRTAERDAANARLALSMEAHQITISGTVASLLHMITLTREAAGCRDGDNLIAVVRGLRADRDEALLAIGATVALIVGYLIWGGA